MRIFLYSIVLLLIFSFCSSPLLPILSIQHAHAGGGSQNVHQRNTRWRDDSTALNSAGGNLTTNENDIYADHPKNTIIRLRVSLDNAGTAIARNAKYVIQWASKSGGSCGDDESYANIPGSDTVTTEHWQMDLSGQYADNDATTTNLLTAGASTFVNGKAVEDTSNLTGNVTADADEYTEVEYAIEANSNATDGGSYCFRLTLVDTFDVEPELSLETPTITRTVAGIVYTDQGTTVAAGVETVCASLDGAAPNVCELSTVTTGVYSLTLTGAEVADTILSIYVDSPSVVNNAVTVTTTSGGNLAGINLYDNTLIIRDNSDAFALTNTNLATADNYSDVDISNVFSVDGSNVLHVTTGNQLLIWTGETYLPGGEVRVGSGIDINGSFAMEANPITLSGSWLATGGTFTNSGNLIIFNDDTGTHSVISNSNPFGDVFFGKPSGSATYQLGDALNVDGNLTISGGTFDVSTGNHSITLSGNWLKVSGATFTPQNGTVTLDGGNQSISGATTFYNFVKTVTSAFTLTFEASVQQIISNSLTLQGAVSNILSLRSSTADTTALVRLTTSGTQSIDYLDVKDIDSSGGEELDCFIATEGCVDSTNNTNWLFIALATTKHWGKFWFPGFSF